MYNKMMSINLYHLFVLVIIDVLGLNKLWGERLDRRVLHHLQRNVYNKNRIPEIYLNQKMYEEDLFYLNKTIFNKIYNHGSKFRIDTLHHSLSYLSGGNYSKKSVIHLQEFDKSTQYNILKIGEKYIPVFEKLINKKLYLNESNDKCFILRYTGQKSNFDWHYDNEDSSCFRALFLFHKKGDIPDFMYLDKDGKKKKVSLDLGDGLFFKGKYTYHGVDKMESNNSERFMISFQYTTNKNNVHKSFCNQIIPAKGIDYEFALRIIFIMAVSLFFKFYYNKKQKKIKSHLFFSMVIFSYIILMYISKYMHIMFNLGTGNPINISLIFRYVLYCLLLSLDIKIALLYSLYILYSEQIIPSYMIKYY